MNIDKCKLSRSNTKKKNPFFKHLNTWVYPPLRTIISNEIVIIYSIRNDIDQLILNKQFHSN